MTTSNLDNLESPDYIRDVSFRLNGKRIDLQGVPPTLLLVDFLRDQGLTGTKVACGEGGCGACTVMLSRFDRRSGTAQHLSVNACLRPLCAIDGMEITTVEALGSLRTGLDPVQYRVAAHNGSQCGFCTPGVVMSAHALLCANPRPSGAELENCLDGNLCRCTGYRGILDGLQTFAVDGAPSGAPHYTVAPSLAVRVNSERLAAPTAAALSILPARPLHLTIGSTEWFRPIDLAEALRLKAKYSAELGREHVRYVAGYTSAAIYRAATPRVSIDIGGLDDLKRREVGHDGIVIGGGLTISELLTFVNETCTAHPSAQTAGLRALGQHLPRVACRQVRNVATVAGNLVMTKSHETGVPFPSDLVTVFAALGATVTFASLAWGATGLNCGVLEMPPSAELPPDAVLVSILLPFSAPDEHVATYKIAAREQDASPIVNAGFRVQIDSTGAVARAVVVYGGLGRAAVRVSTVERILEGRQWTSDTLSEVMSVLHAALAPAAIELPDELFSAEYRRSLAESLFYKFFVRTAVALHSTDVPAECASAAATDDRPISSGRVEYPDYAADFPVGQPLVKFSAFLQATGEALFTHDLPCPPRTAHAAVVKSARPAARFQWRYRSAIGASAIAAAAVAECPGLLGVITVADLPAGGRNLIGLGGDDAVFADGEVNYVGAVVALAVANSLATARAAARFIEQQCLEYEDLSPVLTLQASIDAGLAFPQLPTLSHLPSITRDGSDTAWLANPSAALPGTEVTHGRQQSGAQAHFYLETQATLAVPGEGDTMSLFVSTQDAAGNQAAAAAVLGVPTHQITVIVDRVGGGFGGKQTRSAPLSSAAAVAARALNRPVRLVLDRADDMAIVGKRHPFVGDYSVAFTPDGTIKALAAKYRSDGGCTYDVSFPVMDLAQFLADNTYRIDTFQTEGAVYRTNTASNTAMRSFGTIQSLLIQEDAIEQVAFRLSERTGRPVLAETIRRRNMYRDGTPEVCDATPYGQELTFCNIRALWDELWSTAEFDARAERVAQFNRANRWRKRGLAMTPLKYGVSYTGPRGTLNQGSAMIHVFASDASILVMHGGIEKGQGLDTKMAQIAARTLGLPLERVRVAGTRTDTVANATATAASTGADLNGGAVELACRELRLRLERLCADLQEFRSHKPIDNWQLHWSALWPQIVAQAYTYRVNLTAQAHYKTPHYSGVDLTHPHGHPFFYFVFGAAAAEVEIDVLTGEVRVLRGDILYDASRSLNPCLDIGQIQGAFVQGIGHVMTEEIQHRRDGSLLTDNTWTYKPPCSLTIPIDFRIRLADHPLSRNIPSSAYAAVKGSKAAGEPGLVLATSVFFAIKRAILASRLDRGERSWFHLPAPATVERVQQACRVDMAALTL